MANGITTIGSQFPVICAMVLMAACGGDATRLAPAPTTSLTPTAPAPVTAALSGRYRMSFSADPVCAGLPAAVQTRTYTATANGALITLSGATFGASAGGYDWQSLYVKASGDDVQLYFQDPPIWELLSAQEYVVIYGEYASGSVRELPATLSFDGFFKFCPDTERDSYPECEVPEIVCRSANHRLVIARE